MSIWESMTMAKKIGLDIYSLSMYDSAGKIELHNVLSGKGFLELLFEYIDIQKRKLTDDKDRESAFYFDEVIKEDVLAEDEKKEYTVLYGKVKTGDYGIETELVDVTDGSVYKRNTNQADLLPFGFCIAIPEGQVNNGIIILQTIGGMGMKMALQRRLQECIVSYNTGYNVLWGQVLPKVYIDKFFKQGALQKIRMIRYEIPEDVSNRIGINFGVKQTREERIICKPIGFMERKAKEIGEWAKGQRSCTKIIEIEDFEYDDLKLEFQLGRTNKVISLKDTTGLRVSEDISDKVDIQGGNPEFNSLKEVMKESAREYLIGMGLLV